MDQEGVPVLQEAPEGGAARPETPPGWGSPSNRNKIVLCVDDAAQDLRLLRQCIVGGGFTFVGAASGIECLKIVSRIEPRLILLDVNAPALDGFELCRRLRGNMRLSHVPIAFISARNSPDDVKRGLAAGGNDYILKPVSIARLMERVHHWTSRRLSTDQILGVTRERAAPQAEASQAEADAGPT